MPARPVVTKISEPPGRPDKCTSGTPRAVEASVGVMPKPSGSVFECGAPHQASQHKLNVTMARLMVARLPHLAASSVDPGASASPTARVIHDRHSLPASIPRWHSYLAAQGA